MADDDVHGVDTSSEDLEFELAWADTSSDTSSVEDLEFELLTLSAEGNLSLGRLRKLCRTIAKCCEGVPEHVREIGALSQSQPCHTERDLHRWVKHQHWWHLLATNAGVLPTCADHVWYGKAAIG